MDAIEAFLLSSSMARLTLIAALGYLIGHVRLPEISAWEVQR
jgi:hypothetical protein